MSSTDVRWIARDQPLPACAVAARGAARIALARRALELDAAKLAQLAGADGGGWMIFLGAEELLPWADGVVYLGKDPEAPELLLPTVLAPNFPISLFARAVAAQSDGSPPWAVLPAPPSIVALSRARAIDREVLRAAIERAP